MTLIIKKPTSGKLVMAKTYVGVDDPDAAVYIAAVEAADGQALETATRVAIHSFVKGCKADGIWPAIKASCILAGARTLNGALVPLAGAAPTRLGTEAGWNYNRKTGLKANGTDNYLNSNRANNADPQNSKHLALSVSEDGSATSIYLGARDSADSFVIRGASLDGIFRVNYGSGNYGSRATAGATGFMGASRSSASSVTSRLSGVNEAISQTSGTAGTQTSFVFAFNNNGSPGLYFNGRIRFYSIGESLDLALLDARVTALINAIGAAF